MFLSISDAKAEIKTQAQVAHTLSFRGLRLNMSSNFEKQPSPPNTKSSSCPKLCLFLQGMVAGKIFKGTVTHAPSLNERLDEAEKRARELQPPVCDELCELNKEITATAQRIK